MGYPVQEEFSLYWKHCIAQVQYSIHSLLTMHWKHCVAQVQYSIHSMLTMHCTHCALYAIYASSQSIYASSQWVAQGWVEWAQRSGGRTFMHIHEDPEETGSTLGGLSAGGHNNEETEGGERQQKPSLYSKERIRPAMGAVEGIAALLALALHKDDWRIGNTKGTVVVTIVVVTRMIGGLGTRKV
jgi:hypothetical protein